MTFYTSGILLLDWLARIFTFLIKIDANHCIVHDVKIIDEIRNNTKAVATKSSW